MVLMNPCYWASPVLPQHIPNWLPIQIQKLSGIYHMLHAIAMTAGRGIHVRWERSLRNSMIAVALLVVVTSMSKAGLPVTHRMEEYIAFVLTTDFEHELLTDQANQVASWAEGFGWVNDLGALWHSLETFVAPGRQVDSNTIHPGGGSESGSTLGER